MTDHAYERSDGGDKAKCRLPESVIENIVLQRKGMQYLDTASDAEDLPHKIHIIYNSTVIIADYEAARHRWIIVTVYRDPHAAAKRRATQYREIDVDKVVKQARQA